jgi:hypothetical protein
MLALNFLDHSNNAEILEIRSVKSVILVTNILLTIIIVLLGIETRLTLPHLEVMMRIGAPAITTNTDVKLMKKLHKLGN